MFDDIDTRNLGNIEADYTIMYDLNYKNTILIVNVETSSYTPVENTTYPL